MPSSDALTSEPSRSRRWLARLAIVSVLAAALLVIGSGGFKGVFLLVSGLIGAAALLAGMFWFLARRGITRWIGLVVAAAAIAFLIYSYASADVTVLAFIALGLLAIGIGAARSSLTEQTVHWMPIG